MLLFVAVALCEPVLGIREWLSYLQQLVEEDMSIETRRDNSAASE